jgi:hypothetical protein
LRRWGLRYNLKNNDDDDHASDSDDHQVCLVDHMILYVPFYFGFFWLLGCHFILYRNEHGILRYYYRRHKESVGNTLRQVFFSS